MNAKQQPGAQMVGLFSRVMLLLVSLTDSVLQAEKKSLFA